MAVLGQSLTGHDIGVEGDGSTRAVKEGLPKALQPLDLLGREGALRTSDIAQTVELNGHAIQLGHHGSCVQLVQKLGRVGVQQIQLLHRQAGTSVYARVLDNQHLVACRTSRQHAASQRDRRDEVSLGGFSSGSLHCFYQLQAGGLVRSGLLDVVVLDLVEALGTDHKGRSICDHETGAAARRHDYVVEEILDVGQGGHAVAQGNDEGGIGGHGTVRRTVLG